MKDTIKRLDVAIGMIAETVTTADIDQWDVDRAAKREIAKYGERVGLPGRKKAPILSDEAHAALLAASKRAESEKAEKK